MTVPLTLPSPGNALPLSCGHSGSWSSPWTGSQCQFTLHTPCLSSIPDQKTRVLDQATLQGASASRCPCSGLWKGGGLAEPTGCWALAVGQMRPAIATGPHDSHLGLGSIAVELTFFCSVSIFSINKNPLRPQLL